MTVNIKLTTLFCIGAFSIYNTSTYSNERSFKTSPVAPPSATGGTAGNKSQSVIVIAVALVVSLVLLVIVAVVLYCVMRRKKKQKKNNNTQYVPGLEDLIEMRTRTHSGGAESRGNRDLLELGKERLLVIFNVKSYSFQTILLRLVVRRTGTYWLQSGNNVL